MSALTLLLAAGAVHGQCASVLPAGQTVSVAQPIPGNAFTTSVCIDVPAQTERLTVRLLANNPAQDLDLFVRVDSPFFDPATESITSLTIDDLFERAHYYSASGGGDEFVVISRASKQPLRAGRLYLTLLNFDSGDVAFSVGSTIGSATDFVPVEVSFTDPGSGNDTCNLSGWNDSSPRSPVRGNNGSTLGEQRRNAMLEAARLVSEQLRPAAAIRVRACWDSLEFGSNGGVLAQAGPRFVIVDDPGRGFSSAYLDNRHVVHFSPAAGHQAGTSFCRYLGGSCAAPPADIEATFNLNVDTATNASQRYDYGITPPAPGTQNPSFVAVAMHELGHGLGFVGLIDLSTDGAPVGSRFTLLGQTYDDSYGRFARIIPEGSTDSTTIPFLRATDAERAAALSSGNRLRFSSPRSLTSFDNALRDNIPPLNTVQLHSPLTVSGGSSYSHLGLQHSNQLMLASATNPTLRSLGLALDMLRDMGFQAGTRPVPEYAPPPDVQYFDVARNGHGIDFRRVAGTEDLYFLGFYSYDAAGNPEWYTSLGRIIDGAFQPLQNSFGDTLLRFIYQPGPPAVSQVDSSPGFNGQVRLDFVEARNSPICQVEAAGRVLDGPLALLTWTLDGSTRQWCMQPLVDPDADVELDVSSVWFNPADPGWGITVQSFPGGGTDGIAIGVYYPDAEGRGRWGVVQTANYDPQETYTVRQVQGYCRGPECATPGTLSFVDIGTLQIDLRPPGEGASTLTLDVTYPGAAGGRFQRSNAPLTPANSPRYRGE